MPCRLVDYMFQFTHPGKGATCLLLYLAYCLGFQFTHPGKGATLQLRLGFRVVVVSIHAPWEGCDTTTSISTQTP